MKPAHKYFIIAGESSGDALGADLMRGMKSEVGLGVTFVGVGGPLMKEQGLESIFPMEELSIMGVAEIIPKIPQLRRRIRETINAAQLANPTALITIDSPDFCFRVAKKVKANRPEIPIIHYVAPSVWAWRPKRAAKMAKFVNHVLALLPFEPTYMEEEGMSCDFVGHPISAQRQASQDEVKTFRDSFGIDTNQKVITLLAGSRSTEVSRLAPIFKEVFQRLREDTPDLVAILPTVGARFEDVRQTFSDMDVIILDPRSMPPEDAEMRKRICFASSDVALAASGTVSLELAAAGTPMVIAYQMHWLTAFIKRRLVRVSSATLVNILTQSDSIPEFLLEDCTVENIYPAVKQLLENPDAANAQNITSAKAMKLLGKGSDPSENKAARSVLKFINSNPN